MTESELLNIINKLEKENAELKRKDMLRNLGYSYNDDENGWLIRMFVFDKYHLAESVARNNLSSGYKLIRSKISSGECFENIDDILKLDGIICNNRSPKYKYTGLEFIDSNCEDDYIFARDWKERQGHLKIRKHMFLANEMRWKDEHGRLVKDYIPEQFKDKTILFIEVTMY